jgi:hypothetical protein
LPLVPFVTSLLGEKVTFTRPEVNAICVKKVEVVRSCLLD